MRRKKVTNQDIKGFESLQDMGTLDINLRDPK